MNGVYVGVTFMSVNDRPHEMHRHWLIGVYLRQLKLNAMMRVRMANFAWKLSESTMSLFVI